MYKNASIFTLMIVGLVSGILLYSLKDLQFSYDFEEFFPTGTEATATLEEHREKFGTDNDFLLIGLKNEEGVFEKDFLECVAALTDSLQAYPHLTEVNSPTNLKFHVQDPLLGKPIPRPFLRYQEPESYTKDSARIYNSELLKGNYFSEDGKSISIVSETTQYLTKQASDSLDSFIRNLVDAFDFDESHIAGRSIAQSYYLDMMKNELVFFLGTGAIVVIFILLITFRSLWGVLTPLLVVVMSVLWILGLMAALAEPVNLFLTVLPTIMFVVGISDVIHILSKYLDELRFGSTKIPAIRKSFIEVGVATLLTSITTAIGFLTLTTADSEPIRDFGVFIATGIFLAFLLTYSLLPSTMVLIKQPRITRNASGKGIFWHRTLHRLFQWVIKKKKLLLTIFGFLFLLSFLGINNIKFNNYLLANLKEGNSMKQEFQFFEEHFAGTRPFELSLQVPNERKNIFDHEVLEEINTLHHYLKQEYGVGLLLSPLTLIKSANMGVHGGNQEYYQLPEDPEQTKRLTKLLKKFAQARERSLNRLVTSDLQEGRVAGKMADIGGYLARQRTDSLYTFAKQHLEEDLLKIEVTGTAHLIDLNNQRLSQSLMKGLGIAFGIVALIVALFFRSVRLVFITLLPNVLPLLVVGGIMGATGVDLNVSTAIIFSIAFGIAVDDTIHFMSRLRLELNQGKSLLYAIKRTFISTGKAIMVTSLILCSGFLTLLFSNFLGTYQIGYLIAIVLAFAIISDLLLLPVLLILFYKREKKEP